jgi:DDE superfamily endonuclease
VTGGSSERVSLAALIAVRPGQRPRLICRVHYGRRSGGDRRKGVHRSRLRPAAGDARQQLGGPLVVVWDGLDTHVSHVMADLAAARDWLTVFRLPPYAHELSPVEMSLSQCELRRSSLAWLPGSLSFEVSVVLLSSVQRRRLW